MIQKIHKVLVRISVLSFSILQFLFRTEDDPVLFAITRVFQCNKPYVAAVIMLSTELYHATSNFLTQISALGITGSQESSKAHWFVDISSSWSQYWLDWGYY